MRTQVLALSQLILNSVSSSVQHFDLLELISISCIDRHYL